MKTTSENADLDHKRTHYLITKTQEPDDDARILQKAELLKDVCAMANSCGEHGHIVCGVVDQKGAPVHFPGVDREVDDADIQAQLAKLSPRVQVSCGYIQESATASLFFVIKIRHSPQLRPFQVWAPGDRRLGHGLVFVRRGSSTEVASTEDLLALARQRWLTEERKRTESGLRAAELEEFLRRLMAENKAVGLVASHSLAWVANLHAVGPFGFSVFTGAGISTTIDYRSVLSFGEHNSRGFSAVVSIADDVTKDLGRDTRGRSYRLVHDAERLLGLLHSPSTSIACVWAETQSLFSQEQAPLHKRAFDLRQGSAYQIEAVLLRGSAAQRAMSATQSELDLLCEIAGEQRSVRVATIADAERLSAASGRLCLGYQEANRQLRPSPPARTKVASSPTNTCAVVDAGEFASVVQQFASRLAAHFVATISGR
ncbi:helix-turn-helix domain-containing protein [Planctomycetota bacterium]